MSDKPSTFAVVRRGLVHLFNELGSEEDVAYGWPTRDEEREQIAVLSNPEQSQEDWNFIGNEYREETYPILVSIEVYRPGDELQEAVERAEELFAGCAHQLREKSGISQEMALAGVYEMQIVRVTRKDLTGEGEGEGAGVQFVVRVKARIRP